MKTCTDDDPKGPTALEVKIETWYVASKWCTKPLEALVSRSTEKCVWLSEDNRRRQKIADFENYFTTVKEVYKWMISNVDSEISSVQSQLHRLEVKRNAIKANSKEVNDGS